jgi:hypothetical protein
VTPAQELEYLQLKKKKAMTSSGSKPSAMSGMFDAYKTPSTTPEIAGQTAGQVIGDLIGGPLWGMGLGGLGGAAGRTYPQIPQALGEMMAFKRFKTPTSTKMAKEFIPAFQRGATFSGLGELAPAGWEAAKSVGREVESGIGSLTGVGERIGQLKKFPLSTQLKVLKPRWMGGSSIPTPEVAGAAQGALETKLGIPTVKQVAEEKIFGTTKVPTSIRDLKIGSMGKVGGATASDSEKLLEALKKAGADTAKSVGRPAETMKNVYNTIKTGGKPVLEDAVSALREVSTRLNKAVKDTPEYASLSEWAGKITNEIANQVPEYAKARKLTNLAHIYDELQHILPLAPTGDPYRFGVMRLIWMLRTGLSMVTGGLMSPYTAAAGGVAGNALGKALDPILKNRFLPAAVGAGAAKLSQ